MTNEMFTLRSPMPVPADELYAWHTRPLAFQRVLPPWDDIQIVKQEGTFGSGSYRVTLRAKTVGPVKGTWVAEVCDFQPGVRFQDRALSGPFKYWNHTHLMIPDGENASILEDCIDYQLPVGALGRLFGSAFVRHKLTATFKYRHAVMRSDLKRHNAFKERPRMTIAITGSRGLVGADLVSFLTTGGHQIVRLATGSAQPPFEDGTRWVTWKPDAALDPGTLVGVDAVIHLAGDNVAEGRWNEAKKRRILESRTIPTRHIAEAIAALPQEQRPKVLVCASAVGFYGNRDDEELTEDSAGGSGFFHDVVRAWEAACDPAREAGVRVVNGRIGVVLSPRGGALGKQLLPFKLGGGAVLGNGRQWMPWITIHDLVGAIHHVMMKDDLHGPVNLVSPTPVTNREFTKTLARVLRRPAFMWLPAFALRTLFGEFADEGLLASMKVRPAKLLTSGFEFDHSELELALRFLLGR